MNLVVLVLLYRWSTTCCLLRKQFTVQLHQHCVSYLKIHSTVSRCTKVELFQLVLILTITNFQINLSICPHIPEFFKYEYKAFNIISKWILIVQQSHKLITFLHLIASSYFNMVLIHLGSLYTLMTHADLYCINIYITDCVSIFHVVLPNQWHTQATGDPGRTSY